MRRWVTVSLLNGGYGSLYRRTLVDTSEVGESSLVPLVRCYDSYSFCGFRLVGPRRMFLSFSIEFVKQADKAVLSGRIF